MEKLNRKEIKKRAKQNVKKHYWLLIFVCLMAAILGTDFTDTLQFLKIPATVSEAVSDEDDTDSSIITSFGMDEAYNAVVQYQAEAYEKAVENRDMADEEVNLGKLQIGYSKGVLAGAVNQIKNGTLFLMIYDAFKELSGSKDLGVIFFLLLALLIYTLFYIFIASVYDVVMARIFLEGRVYDKIPTGRFVYLIRVKRWGKAALATLKKNVFLTLWYFTIVGGAIKTFSYFCVPFILAENPDCSGKEAILLSRKMMNGHKWECFVFQLSFLPWNLLNAVTFGVAGLLYANPYMATAFSEYYAHVRRLWIENKGEGYELLNDKYLYEKADQELLDTTYADIAELRKTPVVEPTGGNKILRFLAKYFGITLWQDATEMEYLKAQSIQLKISHGTKILDGKMYPSRLSPIPEKEKIKNLEGIGYLRTYTVVSLILIFFTMCIIGWLWEVSLHLISSGKFVNRGVLHGPWLPIYGMGGILIMLALNRFRKKPALHFVLGMVLAGCVEYYTAWHLEMTHNGQKWWDYSGYFLNLHGRVCAEGLLVFGLGGMAIVYIIAPMLDNQFRKISKKIAIPLCAVLLLAYSGDMIYSHFKPNQGDGITNTKADAGTIITSSDIEIPLLNEGELSEYL